MFVNICTLHYQNSGNFFVVDVKNVMNAKIVWPYWKLVEAYGLTSLPPTITGSCEKSRERRMVIISARVPFGVIDTIP
jgi:hypothetical protein